MTDAFDHDLARLAHRAPPVMLGDLERQVTAAIDAGMAADGGISSRGMVVTGVAALLLGLAGGGLVAGRSEVRGAPGVMLVALDGAHLPSTLLLGR